MHCMRKLKTFLLEFRSYSASAFILLIDAHFLTDRDFKIESSFA